MKAFRVLYSLVHCNVVCDTHLHMTTHLDSNSLCSFLYIQCSFFILHYTVNKLILSARFGSKDYRFSVSESLLGAPTHAHKNHNQIRQINKTNLIIYLYSKNDTVSFRLYIMFIVFF